MLCQKNGLLKVLIRVTKSLVNAIRENEFSGREKETKRNKISGKKFQTGHKALSNAEKKEKLLVALVKAKRACSRETTEKDFGRFLGRAYSNFHYNSLAVVSECAVNHIKF
jgi:hypothetical protein